MKNIKLIILLSITLFWGCAAHRYIEPVGKGNTKGYVNLGGPIVAAFDTKLPIPYLSAGADYGLYGNFDVNANLHLLPLFYEFSGLDVGCTYFPVLNDSWTPTVGLNVQLMSFFSFKSLVTNRFRMYPIISPSFAWKLFDGKIYCGSNFTVPLTKLDYYKDMSPVIASPFLGYSWNLGAGYNLFTELKWNAVNIETYKLAVEYVHPSNHGAIGIYFTLERSF